MTIDTHNKTYFRAYVAFSVIALARRFKEGVYANKPLLEVRIIFYLN